MTMIGSENRIVNSQRILAPSSHFRCNGVDESDDISEEKNMKTDYIPNKQPQKVKTILSQLVLIFCQCCDRKRESQSYQRVRPGGPICRPGMSAMSSVATSTTQTTTAIRFPDQLKSTVPYLDWVKRWMTSTDIWHAGLPYIFQWVPYIFLVGAIHFFVHAIYLLGGATSRPACHIQGVFFTGPPLHQHRFT